MTKEQMKQLIKETIGEMIESGDLELSAEVSSRSYDNNVSICLSLKDDDGDIIASTEDIIEIPSDSDPYEE